MKIIRDEECGGLMMIPLLVDWGIRRCIVKGCRNDPNTIVLNIAPEISRCGLCEQHYQEGNKPGGAKFTLVFDDSDRGN